MWEYKILSLNSLVLTMKVVCIKSFRSTYRKVDSLQYELTYGKVYECETKPKWASDNSYFIKCDKGFISAYDKGSFISLEEYRNTQLNKILC